MTKQVVWTFRKLFFLQFDTKFASKQQRLAKIGTILDCCCRPRFRKFHISRGGTKMQSARPRTTAEGIGHTVPTMRLTVHGCASYFNTHVYWR